MNTREKMKDALRTLGYSKAQIHDVELLSQGFKPEGELDMMAMWHAQKFLICNGDRMEESMATLADEKETAKSEIAALQQEVAVLRREKRMVEMQNEKIGYELVECQRELSREKAKTEYYRQKTDVNSFAMKMMDKVYMPVYYLFNMPNVKMLPLKVMGNMHVSGDVNVQGDMIEKQYLKGWK